MRKIECLFNYRNVGSFLWSGFCYYRAMGCDNPPGWNGLEMGQWVKQS